MTVFPECGETALFEIGRGVDKENSFLGNRTEKLSEK